MFLNLTGEGDMDAPAGNTAGGNEQGDGVEHNENVGAGQHEIVEANQHQEAPSLNALDAGLQNLTIYALMYPAPPSMYGTSKVLLAQGFPPVSIEKEAMTTEGALTPVMKFVHLPNAKMIMVKLLSAWDFKEKRAEGVLVEVEPTNLLQSLHLDIARAAKTTDFQVPEKYTLSMLGINHDLNEQLSYHDNNIKDGSIILLSSTVLGNTLHLRFKLPRDDEVHVLCINPGDKVSALVEEIQIRTGIEGFYIVHNEEHLDVDRCISQYPINQGDLILVDDSEQGDEAEQFQNVGAGLNQNVEAPPPLPLPQNSTRPSLVGKTLVLLANPSTDSGVENEAHVNGSLHVYKRQLHEQRFSVLVISTWDYFKNSVEAVNVKVKGSDLLATLRKQVDKAVNSEKFYAPMEYVFCGMNPCILFDEKKTFRENGISHLCYILLFPVRPEANKMSLILQLMDGQEVPVMLNPTDTIEGFKNVVIQMTGFLDISSLALYHNGQMLEGGKIREHEIKQGDKIRVGRVHHNLWA